MQDAEAKYEIGYKEKQSVYKPQNFRTITIINQNLLQPYKFRAFPSARLIALPRLKNIDCPTIYPSLGEREMDACLSQRH